MDLKVIADKQLVERYLLGRLAPPESRFFEQLVRGSPELADQLGLPDALRRTMRLLDETGTEWREQAPRFWQRPWVPAVLAAAVVLAAVVAITEYGARGRADTRYAEMKRDAEQGLLVAPAGAQTLKIPVVRPNERARPVAIGARAEPTLTKLLLGIGYAPGTAFDVTIKRDDGTYWGRIDNLLRDSNGDLRLTMSSGAFPAGVYEVAIEATDLRGDTRPAGHVQLRVDPN